MAARLIQLIRNLKKLLLGFVRLFVRSRREVINILNAETNTIAKAVRLVRQETIFDLADEETAEIAFGNPHPESLRTIADFDLVPWANRIQHLFRCIIKGLRMCASHLGRVVQNARMNLFHIAAFPASLRRARHHFSIAGIAGSSRRD